MPLFAMPQRPLFLNIIFFVHPLRTHKPFAIVRLPEKLVNKNKDLELQRKLRCRKKGVDGVG